MLRSLVFGAAAAVAAGVAAVLGLAAVKEARWGTDTSAVVMLALGCVFVAQALVVLARRRPPNRWLAVWGGRRTPRRARIRHHRYPAQRLAVLLTRPSRPSSPGRDRVLPRPGFAAAARGRVRPSLIDPPAAGALTPEMQSGPGRWSGQSPLVTTH